MHKKSCLRKEESFFNKTPQTPPQHTIDEKLKVVIVQEQGDPIVVRELSHELVDPIKPDLVKIVESGNTSYDIYN